MCGLMLACLVACCLSTAASPLVSIRTARREDVPALRALAASIESNVPGCSWFESQITDSHYHCLIAILPGSATVVGIALAKMMSADDALPGRAHLSILVVDKRQRRRGCGRLLVQSLRDHLTSTRASTGMCISLYVRESNGAALHFYRKLGFRVHTRVHGYYHSQTPAEDALLLVAGLDELDSTHIACTVEPIHRA